MTSVQFFILYTEGWRHVCSLDILGLSAIIWPNVQVWLILRLAGVVVSESGECVCYIRHHRQVHFAVVVFPIKIQPQVPFAVPIAGNFVVLSEDYN